ncbi:MAG TPA: phytanoyl-CoA dioxygenase family protein, partial [Actinopolymorphaceae bacterium]|nr:phytanoyl-CoA dioxygenase family protein [Actinopolymorphaceae bacterium]
RTLDPEPHALGELRRSDDAVDDQTELLRRLDEDGYLYLPGYLDRAHVLEARHDLMSRLQDEGLVAPGTDPMDGIPGTEPVRGIHSELAKASVPLQSLLYGGRTAALYERLFAEPVRHYDFTWLRAVRPGRGTPPHGDSVFMNRGTHRLLTGWVPLGDVDLALGGLMVLERSHRVDQLRRDYHSRDVDAYCENDEESAANAAAGRWDWSGYVSHDPVQLREDLGLRWATNEFRAGDLVTFTMFTVHGSLDNSGDRIRLSCDFRYQRASEPADPRWIGANPTAHGVDSKRGLIC